VKLDVNGVSATHAELLYRPLQDTEGAALELCICDHSKNGTAVRPGPHVPGSSWASKVAPAWERLITGVPRVLGHGWQVLAPAKSRKGVNQMPFHKRMLTVYTKSNLPTATPQLLEAAGAAAAPHEVVAPVASLAAEDAAKLHKEKKRKKKDDAARAERKRARLEGEKVAPAVAHAPPPPLPDRRILQSGAVEEELARRELATRQGVHHEVARTARPKRRAQASATEPADGEDLSDLSDGDAQPEAAARDEEAEAATRAVAAAAAMRAMKGKKAATPPKRLSELGKSGKEVPAVQDLESDAEGAAPKKLASLTAANLETLGGTSKVIDFDLRSISPISAPGVKPKEKKKKRIARPGGSASPSRKRKPEKTKTKLVGRSKDSPERWNPSPVKAKKRRAGSASRPRSREKRKQREHRR